MKHKKVDRNSSYILKYFILFALLTQPWSGCLRAYGESPPLPEQLSTLDPQTDQPLILKGRVTRNEATESNATQNINASPSTGDTGEQSPPGSDLHKLSATHSNAPHFGLFGRKWSSDDYRKLNYGVLGMTTERRLLSHTIRIIEVDPGLPAALAGIRPGDISVQTNDHVWTNKDDQRTSWQYSDGKAGTPVDETIRRNGQLITFHLVRMNIEDIQNNHLRGIFEKLLRDLGPPSL